MDLFSRKTIRELLKTNDARPKKTLGQSFLVSKNALRKIVCSAEIKPSDLVLEIGPGPGVLTIEMAKLAKRVIAIEKDERMVGTLRQSLGELKNVDVINADILDWDLEENMKGKNYKLVANPPYYITSPIIRKFLETGNQPEIIVLMIQKEVARRICAKPPDMNILAISVQFYGNPKIVSYVSKESFWPKPKVDSAILKITPFDKAERKSVNAESFFKTVKAGFSHPRKQLLNNLSKELKIDKGKTKIWLNKNSVLPESRPETLNLNDWIKLTEDCELLLDS